MVVTFSPTRKLKSRPMSVAQRGCYCTQALVHTIFESIFISSLSIILASVGRSFFVRPVCPQMA